MKAFFFILLFLSFRSFSQDIDSFFYVKKAPERGMHLFANSKIIIDKKIESYMGNYKKEYKKILLENNEDIKEDFFKNIYFNDIYQNYLDEIVAKILNSNPEFPRNVRAFFKFDPEMNATSTGNNYIFINLGLIPNLENESELAFIIGHELAHHYLDHLTNAIDKYYDIMYSDEIQNSLKGMNRLDKLKRLSDLKRGIYFKSSSHSRVSESEADSLSLEFLKNTSYSLNKAILGIEKLNLADTNYFDMNMYLKARFNFVDYPFQDKWIFKKMSMGETMKYMLSEDVRDSIKSHPEVKVRFDKLKEMSKSFDNKFDEEISSEKFNEMRRNFRFQIVESLINENKISEALFFIAKYESAGIKSPFFDRMIFHCLEKIEKAYESHDLGNFVEARNPYFSAEYNKLLIFIDNLDFTDISQIKKYHKQNCNL